MTKNLVTLNGHLDFTYRGQRVRRVVPAGVDPMDHLYDLMTEVRNGSKATRVDVDPDWMVVGGLSEADTIRMTTMTRMNTKDSMSYVEAAGIHCALIAAGLEGSTINKYLSVIRRVWGHELPLEKLEKPTKGVLSLEDQGSILHDMRDLGQVHAIRLMRLMLETGIRISEAMEIRKADLSRGYVHVTRKKGGGRAAMPISPDLYDHLELSVPAETAKLFREQDKVILRKHLKAYGLSPHSLRHTYATRALEAGASIYDVSKALGHSSVMVTERNYAHVVPSDAAKRVQDALKGETKQ